MITNPAVALAAMLMSNTVITGLVGKMNGGTIPFIKHGIISESEGNLPAIGFYLNSGDTTQCLNDYRFTVNCYAGNSPNMFDASEKSLELAMAVVNEFNEASSGIDGYNARTTCSIIFSLPDPNGKQVNTPIDFRIVNI